MNKLFKRYLVIIALLAVIYNLLVLVIPYPHKNNFVFWFSWGAGLIAILSQVYVSHLAFNNKEELKSKLYGWPIFRIGYIYLLVQLAITLLLLIIGAFVSIPEWIVIIVIAIVFVLFIIGLLANDAYRETIEKMENNEPLKTQFIKELKLEVELLVKKNVNTSYYKELTNLLDIVKYSDPVSNESLKEIENEIKQKVLTIKGLNSLNDKELIVKLINETINLMEERNIKCKNSK